jgi:cytochrome c heme-lyase
MGNANSREGSTSPPPSQPPQSIHPKPDPSDAEACPVDHKTREAWLAQARQKAEAATTQAPTPSIPSIPAGESCDSTSISQTPISPPSAILSKLGLDQTREISTIPRAAADTEEKKPANNEIESGKDKSGKWIYPSEQMFFEAMRRKNYDPKAEDMRSIVPIHNAVNERAWGEILEWEKGMGSES